MTQHENPRPCDEQANETGRGFMSSTNAPQILAYQLWPTEMNIQPADRRRDWMDQTPGEYAYRCLPLTMANQNGWVITAPYGVSVTWKGGVGREDLLIEPDTVPAHQDQSVNVDETFVSHFGSGILTVVLPFLFRTPPGTNLWVKGPANWFKDGLAPLEGIVETDWSPSSFTMNWKVTRPDHTIRIEKADPIAMVAPIARGYLESFRPYVLPLQANEQLQREHDEWGDSRDKFLSDLRIHEPAASRMGWQKHYLKGIDMHGTPFPEHQTKGKLPPFQRRESHLETDDE